MKNTLWDSLPVLKAEMEALEAFLRKEFAGDGFIKKAASSLVLGGGKRLRPALVVASAHVGQYDRETVLPLAAALEVLHTATLIHDDIIDGAETRRGIRTLHNGHGNHVAVYAGDYLLAKAVMLLSRGNLPQQELRRLAEAMEAMCTGEVSQYLGRNRVPGYREYLKRIIGKTGILFAMACSAGGRSAGLEDSACMRLWRFGIRFGTAFQIRDDLIDAEGADAGKPTLSDLAGGVVTLPILLAAANKDYSAMLSSFFKKGASTEGALELIDHARRLGTIENTRAMLAAEVQKGLELVSSLPQSAGREMLFQIAGMLKA